MKIIYTLIQTNLNFCFFRSPRWNLTSTPGITFDPHSIDISDGVSFLGVHFVASLIFANHIAHIRKEKTAFGIPALLKARSHISHEALIYTCLAFIHSPISYGIASWEMRINVIFHTYKILKIEFLASFLAVHATVARPTYSEAIDVLTVLTTCLRLI